MAHAEAIAPGRSEAAASLPERAGRIGPNAITRLAEALDVLHGSLLCHEVFVAAGLLRHLHTPPRHMVDEQDVVRLHRAMIALLGPVDAAATARAAGERTGAYLLGHRIPRAAQHLLRMLPRGLAARLLAAAIARHAWTFAGSGRFAARHSRPLQLSLVAAPLCTDAAPSGSAYLAATFETVFTGILGQGIVVQEGTTAVDGRAAHGFTVRFDGRGPKGPR